MGSSGSTMDDVQRALGERGYQLEEQIEDGSRHKVYLAYSGKLCEIVRIAEYSVKDKNHKQRLNWLYLDHPNILKLHEYFAYKKRAYFVYENVAKKPVSRYFDRNPSVTTKPGRCREPLSRRWTQQSLWALKHCNERGLYLHDFNFGDVWVDQNIDANIACFDRMYHGAHRLLKANRRTGNYISPEGLAKSPCQCISRRQQYSTEKAQVWALGASLLELLTDGSIVGQGFRLSNEDAKRNTKTKKEIIKRNTSNLLGYLRETDLSEDVKSLLVQMLAYDVRDRFTVEQALKHPWFSLVDYQGPVVKPTAQVTTKDDELQDLNMSTQQLQLDDDSTCSCTALVVSQEVNVDHSQGVVAQSTSACLLTTIDMVQDTSMDTFNSAPFEDEMTVPTEPVKRTEGESEHTGSPDSAAISIKSFIFAEPDIGMDKPLPSPENRSEMADLQVVYRKVEDEDKATEIGSSSLSVENEIQSEDDHSVERLLDLLDTVTKLTTTVQSKSDTGQVTPSGDGEAQEDENAIVEISNADMAEQDPLLDDQAPHSTGLRYVPSLTPIPEDKEVRDYNRRRAAQSGDTNLLLQLKNKLAIALIAAILLAIIAYEAYIRLIKRK